MKKILIGLLTTLLLSPLSGAEFAPTKPNPTDIRIIPVRPTPEPDNVETNIIFPSRGEVLSQSRMEVQVRLDGYPVGTQSSFDRRKQIWNDPNGQSLRVIIDTFDPFEIYLSFVDTLDQNNVFFNLTLNKQIPFSLSSGVHAIRAFPIRSYGESLKQEGCFDAHLFYVNTKKGDQDVDLKGPYLTYNEPQERVSYREGKPILLDFYLSNVQLSRDGYKVRITINDDVVRILTMWVPYYIYGLKSGEHKIHLELLNEKNEVEPGLFNDVHKTIRVN